MTDGDRIDAIQYVRSVPRWLAVRYGGRAWSGIGTSRLGTVRLARLPLPERPGPAWVRIQPILSGICGSDLVTISARGSPYFSPFVSTPFILGHEIVGTVVDGGPDASRVRAGDRVVVAPPLHCAVRGIDPPCGPCRRGAVGHCRNPTRGAISAGIQTGFCHDTGGGWSDMLVAHEAQLEPVPDRMSDAAAVLVEPFACCLNAVGSAALADEETAVVLGCGTIGLLTIAAIRSAGSRCRVVAVAKYPHQAETARTLGVDEVVDLGPAMRRTLADRLGAELHRPEFGPPVAMGGADVCFDCVGSDRTLDDALRFTRAEGRVIVVGMPGVPAGVDWTALWHKELIVRGSYTADHATFTRAIDLAAAADERLAPLVGARFPLSAYREALACAEDTGRSGVVKSVFEPASRTADRSFPR